MCFSVVLVSGVILQCSVQTSAAVASCHGTQASRAHGFSKAHRLTNVSSGPRARGFSVVEDQVSCCSAACKSSWTRVEPSVPSGLVRQEVPVHHFPSHIPSPSVYELSDFSVSEETVCSGAAECYCGWTLACGLLLRSVWDPLCRHRCEDVSECFCDATSLMQAVTGFFLPHYLHQACSP